MAVPKSKVSKARRDKRRSSVWKLKVPGMAECPQCHEMKLSHRVCKNCGYYDGKEVVKNATATKPAEKATETAAEPVAEK